MSEFTERRQLQLDIEECYARIHAFAVRGEGQDPECGKLVKLLGELLAKQKPVIEDIEADPFAKVTVDRALLEDALRLLETTPIDPRATKEQVAYSKSRQVRDDIRRALDLYP